MFIEDAKRKTLRAVLEQLFQEPAVFQTFIFEECEQRNLYDFARRDATMVDLRSAVITDALKHEWLDVLLAALRGIAGPDVKKRLDSIGTIEEIREARFFDACEADRYPLVDRADLRNALRDVAAEDGPRILLVRGDRHSGKSHTLHHLRHVARQLEVPLAEIQFRLYSPIDHKLLGGIIAAAAQLQIPDYFDEKHWTMSFLNWLGPELASRQRRLWIAIDDFEAEYLNNVPLDRDARFFIVNLADRVGGAMPDARLFLINYDEEAKLPDSAKPRIVDENTPVITDADLVRFFVAFARDHVPLQDDAETAKKAVARAKAVQNAMNPAPHERLKSMRDEVMRECGDIRKRGTL